MPTPGDAIRQAVVDANDNPGAIAFQPMHQGDVPQRMLPVHHLAQNLRGNSFQLSVGTMLQRDLANVVADVEVWVVFPGRKTNVRTAGSPHA